MSAVGWRVSSCQHAEAMTDALGKCPSRSLARSLTRSTEAGLIAVHAVVARRCRLGQHLCLSALGCAYALQPDHQNGDTDQGGCENGGISSLIQPEADE